MISISQFPCRLLGLFFIICHLARLSLAANAAAWRSRSIYQVFTDRFARTDGSTTAKCDTKEGLICGGTWRGIINHLDYIQGLGFDAIMISPVSKNIEGRVSYGEAYHGYWVSDLYQVNHHFGTREDLLDLSKALHDRGMYLMVDVVINNMAAITNGSDPATATNYSILNPFNDKKYYRPYCKIKDYNNYTDAQTCWTGDDIVALPGLDMKSEVVTKMTETWLTQLIANFSIDGLRIDAAKHSITPYLHNVASSSGLFSTGEVFEGDVNIACNYQNIIDSIPNYPVYFGAIKAFTAGNISALANELSKAKNVCKDISILASFTENHDLPRFPSYTKDLSLAKNVIAFTILMDGIPLFYQGQEQHFSGGDPPSNREALWTSNYDTKSPLYQLTATLNKIRAHAIRVDSKYLVSKSYPIYTDGSTIAIRKGAEGHHVTTVYSNQGEKGGDWRLDLRITYTPGTVVTELLSCRNYTVDWQGTIGVQMSKGLPRVLFPAHQLDGSGLCGARDLPGPKKYDLHSGSGSLRPGGALGLELELGGLSVLVFVAALTTLFVNLF
ncbi:hypothetical protein ACJ72_05585 [Emergomyces africanus]|uniref:alpha-amylase n=1 Tax=Emergomyces africanus TaxID=1955775 RepID=A0A1B7NTH3_9EURO|nr:hypothetical protein ACJ72_05585 [Emergomyces africanus]